MFDVISDLNWLAIIVATLVYFILGGLWFSPIAFEKIWDKAIGFDRPKGWKPGVIYYAGPFVGCLVASVATAVLIQAMNIELFAEAIILALIVGIGYAASTTFTNAITPKNAQPLVFGTLVGTYHTTGIVIVSAILFAWR